MKVLLAGYNVDKNVLDDLTHKTGTRQDLTPEVLSAAYARISRDPRAIDEIRKSAREEVERTRRSNETIIFKMGHHSVAEHAVFNFDIIGVSRYVMEAIERMRLCSYTEKSQRYITLEDDFVVPEEIQGTPFEEEFIACVREQNQTYHVLFEALREHVFKKNTELASDPKKESLLEGWAKEDARYVTCLATEAQLGLTINARNLEYLLRRCASHPLDEVRSLGRAMYDAVKEIAPSIIIFHEANDYDQKTYPELACYTAGLLQKSDDTIAYDNGRVLLVHHDNDGDDRVVAALVHTSSGAPYEECWQRVKQMTKDEKQEVFKKACAHMQLYNSLLREFEYASLEYEIVLSAACFGQMKRHRMATITTQAYDPALGITIPQAITDIGMEETFRKIIEKTNTLFYKMHSSYPHIAPYILTNAHQRRILMRTNVRELYHISRLREDAHAQWDIRQITAQMVEAARDVMPLVTLLCGGKDAFAHLYKEVYGVLPTVRETVLPGVRKIQ